MRHALNTASDIGRQLPHIYHEVYARFSMMVGTIDGAPPRQPDAKMNFLPGPMYRSRRVPVQLGRSKWAVVGECNPGEVPINSASAIWMQCGCGFLSGCIV
jgi:hypothetical protein